jgi:hypothetical protein
MSPNHSPSSSQKEQEEPQSQQNESSPSSKSTHGMPPEGWECLVTMEDITTENYGTRSNPYIHTFLWCTLDTMQLTGVDPLYFILIG